MEVSQKPTCTDHGLAGHGLGYGRTRVNGKKELLHRVVYCKHNSTTLADIAHLVVRHTCDNPRCINPHHLVIGTHADNVQDAVTRGRRAVLRNEAHGMHKLTDAQVQAIRSRYKRHCRLNGGGALALEFGVSQKQISNIVNHKARVCNVSISK